MKLNEVEAKTRLDIPKQTEQVDTYNNCAQTAPPEDYIIREIFTYHSPDKFQAMAYDNLRSAARHLAEVIIANVPRGADRTAAIRKLREAIMTANAGIALHGLSL